MHRLHMMALLLLVAFLAACASSNSGSVYTRSQTRAVQTVQMGVIESVRQVQIEGTKTPIGAGAGAVVGGVAGSTVGGGKGKTIATVLGTVAGGVAGAAAEEGITREDGLELTVKLDSGNIIAVVQEADEQFQPGERVRILQGDGVTRVSH